MQDQSNTQATPQQGLQASDYWNVIRNRYGVILLCFLLVLVTSVVITYIMPSKYRTSVTLEIKDVGQAKGVLGGTSRTPGEVGMSGSNFIQTQFGIITSSRCLERVVREENLVAEWQLPDEQSAINRLKGMIRTNVRRGTDLISIEVEDTDPQRAARIATQVKNAYEAIRTEEINRINTLASDRLDAEVMKQTEIARNARLRMHKAMEDAGIVDLTRLMGGRSGEVVTPEGRQIISSEDQLFKLRNDVDQYRTHLDQLKGLEGEDLIRKAPMLGINDPVITEYFPKYNNLKLAEAEALESGLGERHPRMRAIREQLDGITLLLTEAVISVRETLEIQLALAERRFETAEGQTEGSRSEYMENNLKTVNYMEARDDYWRQSDILKAMILSSNKERIEQQMPRLPVIEWEAAQTPDRPASPKKTLNYVLGAVLGLMFGIGLAFLLEFMDTSVKSMEEVERYLGVPVLAVIPQNVGILLSESGFSPDAEAYRILRTNIEFNRTSADANSITVVSGGAGEGKSTTLLNLAYVCAQGGYNTLIVDADLRRPSLHTYFDISNSVGLTNYLTTGLALEDVILQTPVENLYFMPSGILPADAAGILNSRRMSELIADVKSRFDLVLVDSPPILGVSDASVLVSEVDSTIVVVQHRKLPRNMLMRVKQAVDNVGGHMLGVVLNNVDIRSDQEYQYYTSYYTYYTHGDVQGKKLSDFRDKPVSLQGSAAKRGERGDVSVDDDAF